ncbi:MAG: hypothetical protein GXP46_12470 [Deferribacteres bacterium]|nr:hypothetical protein [Deferribacteres bacterium]
MKRFETQGSGFRIIPAVVFFILYLVSSNASAHKVNIYAYAEDGMVFSEGYFADGSRSRNSRIEVIDAKTGEKLLEGKTGDDGRFSFKIPKAASLRLILHAGMGHQNDYTLSEEEIREALGMEKSVLRDQEPEAEGVGAENKTRPAVSGASPSEIEKAVEKVIDRKLQPVIRMLIALKENSEKPGITEILGGIGYIMGLMGIIMYFKSRRRD